MSRELIEALRGTRREQVDTGLGQVPLGNNIARAGQYNVVVAPVASSNEFTQLAANLSKFGALTTEFGRFQQARGQEEARQLSLDEVIRRVESGDTEAEGLLAELGKQRAFSHNIYRRYNAEKVLPAFQAKRNELGSLTPEQLIERGIKSPDDFESYARAQFAEISKQFQPFVSNDRFMAQMHNDYLEKSIPAEASSLAGDYTKYVRAYNKQVYDQSLSSAFYSYSDAGTNGEYSEGFVDLVKKLEGFTPTSKKDGAQFSVGYGTRAQGAGISITKEQADTALREELSEHYEYVTDLIEEFDGELALNNNQIQALTSFSFNLGPDDLRQLLTGSKEKGKGELRDLETIRSKMLLYNKFEGKALKGLTDRRKEELALFDTPIPDDQQEKEGEGAIVGRVPYIKQAQAKIYNSMLAARANPDVNNFQSRSSTEDSFIAGLLHLAKIGKEDEAYELFEHAEQKGFKFSPQKDSPNLFTGPEGEAKLEQAQRRLDAITDTNEADSKKKAKERIEQAGLSILADLTAKFQAGENPEDLVREAKGLATSRFNAARVIPGNENYANELYVQEIKAIDDFFGGVKAEAGNSVQYSDIKRQQDHDNYGLTAALLKKSSEALAFKGVQERVAGLPADVRKQIYTAKGLDPLNMDSYFGTEDREVRARAVELWQGIRSGKHAELEREFHQNAQAKLNELRAKNLSPEDFEDAKRTWEQGLIDKYNKEIFSDFIEAIKDDKVIKETDKRKEDLARARRALKDQDKLSPIDGDGNLRFPSTEVDDVNFSFLESRGITNNAKFLRRGTAKFDEVFGDKTPNQVKEFYLEHRGKIFTGFLKGEVEHPEFTDETNWLGDFLAPTYRRGELVAYEFTGKNLKGRLALLANEAKNDFVGAVNAVGLTKNQVLTKLYRPEGYESILGQTQVAPINLEEYFDLDELTTSERMIYNIEALYDEKLSNKIAEVYELDPVKFRTNQRKLGVARGLLKESN
jgi:lysozyme